MIEDQSEQRVLWDMPCKRIYQNLLLFGNSQD